MKTVYLGLGSSVGEREKIIHSALFEIKKWGENFKESSFFYSEPWGGVAQNEFVNAVCSFEINEDISPEVLLEKIQKLENDFHRTRTVRWEDRTLDVDILLYGNDCIKTEKLTVPHIHILNRDFVYLPLLEIFEGFHTKNELQKYINSINKEEN